MSKALFITANELKRKSLIDGNVDDDKIVQYIEVAQDTHIQNYMGTNLYNKIQNLIITENTTPGTGIEHADNSAYKTLWVSYIKPMLIWYAQEAFLPFAMFQLRNGGIYKHSSEKAESASLEEMRMLLQEVRQNAEFYTRRFIDYVCDNESSYPEYVTTSTTSDMHPDKDTSFTGWVL